MPASNAFELQTLTWTTRHFEDGRMTIVDFKDQITSKNAAYGIKVTRIEIEYDWATNLFRLYGRDDPLRDFYYEQVSQLKTIVYVKLQSWSIEERNES